MRDFNCLYIYQALLTAYNAASSHELIISRVLDVIPTYTAFAVREMLEPDMIFKSQNLDSVVPYWPSSVPDLSTLTGM
jgi:hypothetical protein